MNDNQLNSKKGVHAGSKQVRYFCSLVRVDPTVIQVEKTLVEAFVDTLPQLLMISLKWLIKRKKDPSKLVCQSEHVSVVNLRMQPHASETSDYSPQYLYVYALDLSTRNGGNICQHLVWPHVIDLNRL
jgi:hypothetical protein